VIILEKYFQNSSFSTKHMHPLVQKREEIRKKEENFLVFWWEEGRDIPHSRERKEHVDFQLCIWGKV